MCARVLTQAGADRQHAQFRVEKLFRNCKHQPRLAVVDTMRSSSVPRVTRPARAVARRDRRSDRPHHPTAAADDADMAVQALVAVACARGQAVAALELSQRDAMGGGKFRRVDAKGLEMQFSSAIRSVGGEETGLEAEKAEVWSARRRNVDAPLSLSSPLGTSSASLGNSGDWPVRPSAPRRRPRPVLGRRRTDRR